MLLKLYLILTGYLLVRVQSPNPERFLNLCVHKQIYIRSWKKQENGAIVFFISVKDFRKIKPLLQKTKSKIHILERHGVPFFIHRNRHRKTFFVSLLLACTLVYLSTLYIWDINITGVDYYTTVQMIGDIQANYIKPGTLKKNVDCFELEKTLRREYDKIGWISCDVTGTQLNVIITETVSTDETSLTGENSDLVAAEDCRIDQIITRSGTPQVVKGDTVKKGDILISGVIPIQGDYDVTLDLAYVEADGDIYGITTLDYQDEFSLNINEKSYTGKKKTRYSLHILDTDFALPGRRIPYENYDQVTDVKKLHLGKTFYLPFSLSKISCQEYTVTSRVLTEEEARSRAKKRYDTYISSLKEKNVEILENNVTIEISDNICRASGTLTVSKPVAVRAPINKDIIQIDEQTNE